MSASELRQLIPFLHDKNPQVRQIALANLLGHTPKESPNRSIFLDGLRHGGLERPQDTEIIRALKLLCRDQLATAHDAFRALVNLSDDSLFINALSEPSFLTFLVSYILNAQSTLADLASMLLSNITSSPAACSAILSFNVSILPDPKSPTSYYPVDSRAGTCPAPVPYPSEEPKSIPALPLLLDAFLQAARVEDTEDKSKHKRKAELHFLSSVFANVSRTPVGRMFFLTPRPANPLQASGDPEYPLSKLLVFTEHKDVIRRGGVASTLKNCAFQIQAHRAILSPDTVKVTIPPSTIEAPGITVLPDLLMPLAGPEEFDLEDQELLPAALQFLPPTKTREPDPVIRLTHVETLLLLCTTFWGREYMRANGVYQIIRALHESEADDKIAEHIERLVNFLQRDESSESRKDGLEFTDAVVSQDAQPDDDEDSRIEEV
ncbi:unnamed protein product [Somion occarium]|uniref:Protein HGH1 homolog n=1 Tax=Somion occarium TaxID=3059160 RepID=A0ABP1E584_9APHY